MNIETSFTTNAQSAEAVEPSTDPFHHPTELAQTTAVIRPSHGLEYSIRIRCKVRRGGSES
jgi:hypothetical protein